MSFYLSDKISAHLRGAGMHTTAFPTDALPGGGQGAVCTVLKLVQEIRGFKSLSYQSLKNWYSTGDPARRQV